MAMGRSTFGMQLLAVVVLMVVVDLQVFMVLADSPGNNTTAPGQYMSPPPPPAPPGDDSPGNSGDAPGHNKPPPPPEAPGQYMSPPPPPAPAGDDSPGNSGDAPGHNKPPPPPEDECTKVTGEGDEGKVCGDPKLVGGDGVMFYFHGRKNQDFCLVSDSDLHINAHFIGRRPEGRQRDFTWVQALGFVYGPHSLVIAAKNVSKWDDEVDQLEVTYNGVPVEFPESVTAWETADGVMSLDRIGATNKVDLVIKEKMGVALTVVPITEKENLVHKYGLADDEAFAHFNMAFRFQNLSQYVNGVLGQTYAPGFVNPVKRGVSMPIMGGADRFVSSSLLSTDCKTSQYTGSAIPAGSAMPSFLASCTSNDLPNGVPGGISCRR